MITKVLLVDDEDIVRDGLKRQLERLFPGELKIAEASSVDDAIGVITEMEPDVVLLDIHLKDRSGFDVLEHFPSRSFGLIFVTAYDQYAIQAFDHFALSYLLKPVDPSKLAKAFERARDYQSSQSEPDLSLHEVAGRITGRIPVPSTQGIRFLPYDEIHFVEAEGNYFTVHLENGESILVSKTMRYFEAMQAGTPFLRVHRSYIVNLSKVMEYVRTGGGYIRLIDGKELPLSDKYKRSFKEAMGGV